MDLTQNEWHQVFTEYLEYTAIAKDYNYYLKHPDSFFYPLMKSENTTLYRGKRSYTIPT